MICSKKLESRTLEVLAGRDTHPTLEPHRHHVPSRRSISQAPGCALHTLHIRDLTPPLSSLTLRFLPVTCYIELFVFICPIPGTVSLQIRALCSLRAGCGRPPSWGFLVLMRPCCLGPSCAAACGVLSKAPRAPSSHGDAFPLIHLKATCVYFSLALTSMGWLPPVR